MIRVHPLWGPEAGFASSLNTPYKRTRTLYKRAHTHTPNVPGHQNSFDVCWPKGSIAETIFTPMVRAPWGEGARAVDHTKRARAAARPLPSLPCARTQTVHARPRPPHHAAPAQVKRIEAAGGAVRGGRLVVDVTGDAASGVTGVTARDVVTGEIETYPADAVVSAIGVTGGWAGLGWGQAAASWALAATRCWLGAAPGARSGAWQLQYDTHRPLPHLPRVPEACVQRAAARGPPRAALDDGAARDRRDRDATLV